MPQTAPKPPKRPRRKQEDRSRETREKLLAATRVCVARDGYGNATIAKITEKAGLTRGAHLHHYATKEQLMAAATEDAGHHVFRRLGLAMRNLENEENRVKYLIDAIWRQVILTSEGRLMLEFLNASATDPVFAAQFGQSFKKVNDTFRLAASHYFVPTKLGLHPADVFEMVMFQMQGMMLNRPVSETSADLERSLGRFVQLIETAVAPRPGPLGEPPRFDDWLDGQMTENTKEKS